MAHSPPKKRNEPHGFTKLTVDNAILERVRVFAEKRGMKIYKAGEHLINAGLRAENEKQQK